MGWVSMIEDIIDRLETDISTTSNEKSDVAPFDMGLRDRKIKMACETVIRELR